MGLEQVCLTIKRGDTWERVMYFQDANEVPIDITGWTVFFTVKRKADDSDDDAVIKKTITTFSNPGNGEADIILTSIDTDLDIGSYLFDIQIKTSSDEIITVLEGIITISKDITIRTE